MGENETEREREKERLEEDESKRQKLGSAATLSNTCSKINDNSCI